MRCSRCGNENSEQNRFCGMCGASLLAAPAPASAQPQPVPVATPAAAHEPVAARAEPSPPPHASSANSPSISGPSFLGLNDPPSTRVSSRKRARLSIDPHSAPGGNLDYLLSEEEPPRHWGPGKILLLLIALALAVGFGYLRFRTHGFAFLNPTAKKPDAAVAQNTPTPDTSAQTTPPASTPEPQPPSIQPAPVASSPAPDTTPSNSNPAATTPPLSTDSAPATSTEPGAASSKPIDSSAPENPDATSPADKDSSSTTAQPAAKLPAPKPTEKPKPAPKPSLPKPSPATRPVAPADSIAEARKYIYGKGAAQDCERGMRLLKPAANQANPKAMIEMGALYSAGLCTPRDLPTAYRWFALALRKDPENTSIHADLSKLWKEMTPAEQQLAIKLTQ